MKETEKKIDDFISSFNQDYLILLIFLGLIICCFIFKSILILTIIAIIIIIIIIGGYSNFKIIAKQVLKSKLISLGGQEDIIEEIINASNEIPTDKNNSKIYETKKEVIWKNISIDSYRISLEGRTAFSNDDYDTAIDKFMQAIELDKFNWMAYSFIGSIKLFFKEDIPGSLEYLEPAMVLDKNHYNHFMNAGFAYYCLEKYIKAIECFETSIKILKNDPNTTYLPQLIISHSQCYYRLSDIYEKLSKFEKSKTYIAKSFEIIKSLPNKELENSIYSKGWYDMIQEKYNELFLIR